MSACVCARVHVHLYVCMRERLNSIFCVCVYICISGEESTKRWVGDVQQCVLLRMDEVRARHINKPRARKKITCTQMHAHTHTHVCESHKDTHTDAHVHTQTHRHSQRHRHADTSTHMHTQNETRTKNAHEFDCTHVHMLRLTQTRHDSRTRAHKHA